MKAIGGAIITGAAWVAVETWGRQFAMFAVFVILARHLGPEAFGLAALAMVMPTIVAVPVTRGIPEALIQRPNIEFIHFDSAFWLLAVTGSVLSGLVWGFAGVIAAAFSQPVLEELVRWTSIVIVLQSLAAVPAAILQAPASFSTVRAANARRNSRRRNDRNQHGNRRPRHVEPGVDAGRQGGCGNRRYSTGSAWRPRLIFPRALPRAVRLRGSSHRPIPVDFRQ